MDKLIPETYRDSPLANRIKLKQHYINVTSNLIDLRKVKIKFGQTLTTTALLHISVVKLFPLQ